MPLACPICGHHHGRGWAIRPLRDGPAPYCAEKRESGMCGCEVSLADALAAAQVMATLMLAATYGHHQQERTMIHVVGGMARRMADEMAAKED